ncbi:MAG: hypothetical protein IPM02_17855 [Betaproteobacteria bacterium]|nr:hypothetical protein [Betaproteobacteria bacterium]
MITLSGTVLYAALEGGSVYQYSSGAALWVVTEFYNTPLDNHFITADPERGRGDQYRLGAAGPGWGRTGAGFTSIPAATPMSVASTAEHRAGPNLHFSTVSSPECNGLKAPQAGTLALQPRWNSESLDFISTPLVNGACPAGTVPISSRS